MSTASLFDRPRKHRKVKGIAAALLPYETDGRIAVDAFQKHLLATHRAGLENAVNMDTGYVNFLSDAEKMCVLQWTREALEQTCRLLRELTSKAGLAPSLNFIANRWMRTWSWRYADPLPDESASRQVSQGKGGNLSGIVSRT